MGLTLKQRQHAFVQLGETAASVGQSDSWPGFECGLTEDEWNASVALINSIHTFNGWFTPQNVRNALTAWGNALSETALREWQQRTAILEPSHPKTIAVICAGNIPAVGFHDILCVLLSGHKALIKLSSDDQHLIPMMLTWLCKFEPEFASAFSFTSNQLSNFDAVIATGSNNSSRYFEQYFSAYPHIFRKSRNSIAVLDGSESKEELAQLGKDIFLYFGLGCRSVTKIYIPRDFDLNRFFDAIYSFHPIVHHNKYANNYDYNKAVWLLNKESLLDNGFLLLKEDDDAIACPTASLYYERYDDLEALNKKLKAHEEKIQCIVGHSFLPLGTSQQPHLWDYADGVNTLAWLNELDKVLQ